MRRQVVPPSMVRWEETLSVTQAVVPLTARSRRMSMSAPTLALSQCWPPSCVRSSRPLLPPTQPTRSFRKVTLSSLACVPVTWAVQVLPPSVVASTVPDPPTAQPRWPSSQK